MPADELEVEQVTGPIDGVVRPPGSKSITNRALVCAGLAAGDSELSGVLFADDTEAMLGCLAGLGVGIRRNESTGSVTVSGVGGQPGADGALLDARLSGTTSRFIAPFAALGNSTVVLDGEPQLRARPMGVLLDALGQLGASIEPLGEPGFLPVQIDGSGLGGGEVDLSGDISSQFLSGLLMAAPAMRAGLRVHLTTELVSKPYVDLTLGVMADFGVTAANDSYRDLEVTPQSYQPLDNYQIEPDASAASYFLAAAAVTGGKVRVEGLGRSTAQGDIRLVDVLERMGATVRWEDHAVELTGPSQLKGVDVDMADFSDVAQTLAVVASRATNPTRVTGIGFIRGKETDRLAAVVTELNRLGIEATEDPDGFTINPGEARPAVVQTYDDHRMAMSFAILGLVSAGVVIADPHCVAKTYPGFWQDLEALRTTGK